MIKALKKLPLPAKLFFTSVIAIAGFIGGCEWKLSADLNNAVRDAKSSGYVTELDEFKKLLPKPSPAKDSGPLVRSVIEFYGRTSKVRLPYDAMNRYRPTEQDLTDLEPYFTYFDEAASLIKQFQNLEPPDMKRDWSQANQLLFPDNRAMHWLTTLACKKANLLALEGNLDDALKLLAEIMFCAELFGNEPTQLSLITRVNLESKVLTGLNEILYQKQISKSQFQHVRNVGAQLKPIKPMDFYMQSDVVLARIDYSNGSMSKTATNITENSLIENGYGIALKTSFSKITLKKLIDIDSKAILLAKKHAGQPRALLKSMYEYSHLAYDELKPPVKHVVEMHMPYFGDNATKYVSALVIRDMFNYLNDQTLKNDPFGKGKYIVKQVPNGRLLYSVGQFGEDRGGIEYYAFRGSLRPSNFPMIVIPDIKDHRDESQN